MAQRFRVVTYSLAHLIDESFYMKVNGDVNGDAETSNALSSSDQIVAEYNNINYTFRSESSTGDSWVIRFQQQIIWYKQVFNYTKNRRNEL